MESTCIVIPALEPEPGLAERIRKLRKEIPGEVILVDDGSGPGYREIFDRAEKTAGCIVLRHDKNRGKGRALKTGFAWILNRWKPGEERIGILCMDCDGQHLPEDGAILLEKARQQPGSLVLGVRIFPGPACPGGPGSGTGSLPGSWRWPPA